MPSIAQSHLPYLGHAPQQEPSGTAVAQTQYHACPTDPGPTGQFVALGPFAQARSKAPLRASAPREEFVLECMLEQAFREKNVVLLDVRIGSARTRRIALCCWRAERDRTDWYARCGTMGNIAWTVAESGAWLLRDGSKVRDFMLTLQHDARPGAVLLPVRQAELPCKDVSCATVKALLTYPAQVRAAVASQAGTHAPWDIQVLSRGADAGFARMLTIASRLMDGANTQPLQQICADLDRQLAERLGRPLAPMSGQYHALLEEALADEMDARTSETAV
jgi:hypothetical protein